MVPAALTPVLVIGCNGLLGIGAPAPAEGPENGPVLADGSMVSPDVTVGTGSDAAGDASPSSDAGLDALVPEAAPDGAPESSPVVEYHDAADPAFWESYALSIDAAVTPGFAGGAFDGRYLYVPSNPLGSSVARYDTQSAKFSEAWDVIALPAADGNVSLNPWGAVYNGASVTFPPGTSQTLPSSYAPSDPFASASISVYPNWVDGSNWSAGTYCGGVALPSASGGPGAVIFAPLWSQGPDGAFPDYTVALFDGQKWLYQKIPAASLEMEPTNFCGAVFDGRYVYFVPSTGAPEHLRFDTQYHPALADSFADTGAWLTVQVGKVGTHAAGFFGGVFDGRYVYYVPYSGTVVARFDTTKPFDEKGSWLTFDLTPLATPAPTGFQGGAFDGRYVYLIPTTSTPDSYFPRWWVLPTPDAGTTPLIIPPLVRYETSGDKFSDASSWQAFDLHLVNAGVAGFTGGIFDGEYLYFVPANNALFLRFRARDASGMGPPGPSHGSFF
jgi:hypothetical protein